MNRRKLLQLFVLASLMAAAGAPDAAGGIDGRAAFDRLKTLRGSWRATLPNGQSAVTTFDVVGDGTVIVERYANPMLPGGGQMLTAYHLDGTDLLLTHYCIAHNQPTLRADRFDPVSDEVQFEFLRASNLASADAGHMRRAKYRIDAPDRFTTEWEYFRNGRRQMVEIETFNRVK